jgi:hypothetical protein
MIGLTANTGKLGSTPTQNVARAILFRVAGPASYPDVLAPNR